MFTNNWFQIAAKKNFEKYVTPLASEEGLFFLEVGCYEGQASCWIMENTKAELTVIDTFEGSKEHDAQFEKTLMARFEENVKEYRDRILKLVGKSREHLKRFSENKFDFIYIDGSHQASDVLEDAILAFPLLKKDGIMIFDDYTWGAGLPYYDRPVNGIDAFLDVYGDQLAIMEKNAQVIIKKK